MFLNEGNNTQNERIKEIYRFIRKNKVVEITEIKNHLTMAHATAVRVVDSMLEETLIIEAGEGESSGGRKPITYSINPVKKYIIGIELSNLYTTILLMDLNLDILSERKLKMSEDLSREELIEFIVSSEQELIKNQDVLLKDLLGIGIGILVDVDHTVIKTNKYEFKDFKQWDLIEMKQILTSKLGCLVMIGSATNLAALVEYRKNYWKNKANVIFVSSDLLIRSSLILNGSLLYKENEMTESFGHTVVNPSGKKCSCGLYGCLNTESSLPSIHKEVINKLKLGYKSSITESIDNIDAISYYHILEGIEEKDQLCLDVLENAIYYFGIALTNLALQFSPETIILGGTLSARSFFFDKVKEIVENRLQNFSYINCEIKSASESFNTVSQGAGCMILDMTTGEHDQKI